jgi:C-type mannose receptor
MLERFLESGPSLVWARLMGQSSLIDNDIKTYNGHQYKFFERKMSWHRAKISCEIFGGHLVTISDQDEQDFVAKLPPKLDNANRVWIGFSDRHSEGKWEWITDENLSFQNWAPGLPDNLGGNQDCAEMGYAGSKWNDKESTSRFAFICEWEVNQRL